MKIHSKSDLEHLSYEELDQIIHDEHITANQLNILAGYFRHLNAINSEKFKELNDRVAKVDRMLSELNGGDAEDKSPSD